MGITTPMALTPTLNCVERVRSLFVEILKRRLDQMHQLRPDECRRVATWLWDCHCNTNPVFILSEGILAEIWDSLNRPENRGIRDFVMNTAYELRCRSFDNSEDWTTYISQLADGISQFNDQESVIDPEIQQDIPVHSKAKAKLAGNSWAVIILQLEQLDAATLPLLPYTLEEVKDEQAAQ